MTSTRPSVNTATGFKVRRHQPLHPVAHASTPGALRALAYLHLDTGLQTEKKERAYLAKTVPQTPPIPRVLGKPLETVDENGFTAINPRSRPRDRVCYDLSMDDLLARLMDYNPRAREQCANAARTRSNTRASDHSLLACHRIWDSIVRWRTMPDDIVTSSIGKGCRRVVTDITDAALFNDHPEFGLQARVSEDEARRTSKESPLKMAFLLSWDGLKASAHSNRACTDHTGGVYRPQMEACIPHVCACTCSLQAHVLSLCLHSRRGCCPVKSSTTASSSSRLALST